MTQSVMKTVRDRSGVRDGRRRLPAGFSLVEILVVITIIGLLVTMGTQAVQSSLETGRVTKCKANLRDIAQSMGTYVMHRNKGRWPRESGMRFLLILHRDDEISGKNTEIFCCPGTADRNDEPGGESGAAYADWENIDSATISYAGRDVDNHRILPSRLEDMIIASDDNEIGPNHKTITNYAYADGSVYSFDIAIDGRELLEEYPHLKDEGLPIGPDCPLEKFQVLRVD